VGYTDFIAFGFAIVASSAKFKKTRISQFWVSYHLFPDFQLLLERKTFDSSFT